MCCISSEVSLCVQSSGDHYGFSSGDKPSLLMAIFHAHVKYVFDGSIKYQNVSTKNLRQLILPCMHYLRCTILDQTKLSCPALPTNSPMGNDRSPA